MYLKCCVGVILLLVAVSVSGNEKKQEATDTASSAVAAAGNHHPVFLPGSGHGDNLASGQGSGHVIRLPGVLNLPLQNPFNLPDQHQHHGVNSASSQFLESAAGQGFNDHLGSRFNDASFSQFDQSAQLQGGQNFQEYAPQFNNHQAVDFNQQDVQFVQQTPQFPQSDQAQFQQLLQQAPQFNHLPAAPQLHQQQASGAQFHRQSSQFEGFGGASFNQQTPQSFQNYAPAQFTPQAVQSPPQNHRVEIVIKHEPQQQQVVYRTDQVHQRQPAQISTAHLSPQTLTQVVKQVERLTPAVITSNTLPQLTTVSTAKKEQLPQLDHRFDVISTVKQPQPVQQQVQRVISVPQPIQQVQQVRVVQQQQQHVQKPVQVQRIVSVPQQKVQQVRIVQVPAPVVQKPVQQIQQVHQVQRVVQQVQPIQQVQRVQQVQQVQRVQQVQQPLQQGYHVHSQALTQAEYERLGKLQLQDPASIRSYHLRDLLEGRGSYSSQYEGLVKNVQQQQQQQPIQVQRVQTQSPALAQRFDSSHSTAQKQNVRVVSAPAPTPAPSVALQTPVQNVQIVRQQQQIQQQPIQFQQVQQVQQTPVQNVRFVQQQQQQQQPLQLVQLRNVQQTLPIVSFSDNINLAPIQSQFIVSTPAPVTLPYQNFGIVATPAPVLSHVQTFTTAPIAQPLLLQRLDNFSVSPAEQLSQQTSQNEIRTAFRSKPASKVDSDEYVDVEETFSVEANANIVEKNGVARRAENINEILQKIKH